MGDLPPTREPAADRALTSSANAPQAHHGRLGKRVLGPEYRDQPGYPGRGPVYELDRHRSAGDRAVEAMLASIHEPCSAHQLAGGLGWTLERTVDALQRLEMSLANTGQMLTRLGHNSYLLGPRPGLPHRREVARCLRHDAKPLSLADAAVLHRGLTCSQRDRERDALRSPEEHGAAERLIAAGLIEDEHGVLRPTPRAEATFRAAPHPRDLRSPR